MLIEILIILLIIIVLLVFLLFFKTWYLHITFKNYNLEHDLLLDINFLFIQITLNKLTSDTTLSISLKLFSHKKHLFSKNLNSIIKSKKNSEITKENNDDNENKEIFSKIKDICPLLIDSKEELYKIIKLLVQIVKFQNSTVEAKIGLGDNNLTIKLCNLLWALSAPLYPLHFQLILAPQINETIIESEGNIYLGMKLINLLKIVIIIVKNSKLRDLVKRIISDK